MTAEEFEAAYAARSGVTIADLHENGLHAEPCDCGEDMCEGWAMVHLETRKAPGHDRGRDRGFRPCAAPRGRETRRMSR